MLLQVAAAGAADASRNLMIEGDTDGDATVVEDR